MHAQAAPPATDNPPRNRVGRFYIIKELGRGSVGRVFLAHDPIVGRDIALKTLHPDLTYAVRTRQTALLIKEARALGRLSHGNIVTVYDASSEGTTPFIAMEYLRGCALSTLHQIARRFTPDEVANIGWRLAEALDHAHQHKVIHRDVTPSNIFLSADLQPKLMDFGIARSPNLLGEWDDDEEEIAATVFQRDAPLGTPNYMSPEQAQGKPADERSDVYGLGAVLYEMLTGQRAFAHVPPEDLLDHIAFKSPLTPQEANPEIPSALAHIIMRAMSKRPEKRFPSAQKLAQELKRYAIQEKRDKKRQEMQAIARIEAVNMAPSKESTPPSAARNSHVARAANKLTVPAWVWVAVVAATAAIGVWAW